jgi:long-chain acyl-CoA synthetase
MYGGLNEQYVETAVRFEDGRTGKISATLKVIDAEVFPALKKAA